MILEQGKVYKVKHGRFTPVQHGWVDYIIFSPMHNIKLPDDYFSDEGIFKRYGDKRDIDTIFTVCFNNNIVTKNEHSQTGLEVYDSILELTDNDLLMVKKAMEMLGHGYKYNRKLNKIVSFV